MLAFAHLEPSNVKGFVIRINPIKTQPIKTQYPLKKLRGIFIKLCLQGYKGQTGLLEIIEFVQVDCKSTFINEFDMRLR